jgi:two-component system OmpR family response regulator
MELRIFLVEDLPNMQWLMAHLIASVGGLKIAGTATTEAEAKLWLEDHPGGWDIALVDLVLQQGSGFGVLDHGHRAHATGKMVVFSSYASPGVREHCLSLGAEAVFEKSDSLGFLGWLRDQIGNSTGPTG